MNTKYFLCNEFGKYVALDSDGSAILIDTHESAESWDSADECEEAAPSFSFAVGYEVRLVTHVL